MTECDATFDYLLEIAKRVSDTANVTGGNSSCAAKFISVSFIVENSSTRRITREIICYNETNGFTILSVIRYEDKTPPWHKWTTKLDMSSDETIEEAIRESIRDYQKAYEEI